MVVEDDPAISTMLSRALGLKYDVRVHRDGTAALESAAGDPPDLALLDVTVPGMDGFAVAEAMKKSERLRRVPIIFLTARDHSMDVIRGIQSGARHYITKPFRLEDLAQKIEKLLGA